MLTDPIADMLTRIRNAIVAKHDFVDVPASKLKIALAEVLKKEGFVHDYEVTGDSLRRIIRIHLAYTGKKEPIIAGLQRVSKPGLRVYVQRGEIPRVYGGLGTAVLSTPQGLMTGKEAWQSNQGGELLCYVW
jgi:small subunit ribosomal protein S8